MRLFYLGFLSSQCRVNTHAHIHTHFHFILLCLVFSNSPVVHSQGRWVKGLQTCWGTSTFAKKARLQSISANIWTQIPIFTIYDSLSTLLNALCLSSFISKIAGIIVLNLIKFVWGLKEKIPVHCSTYSWHLMHSIFILYYHNYYNGMATWYLSSILFYTGSSHNWGWQCPKLENYIFQFPV